MNWRERWRGVLPLRGRAEVGPSPAPERASVAGDPFPELDAEIGSTLRLGAWMLVAGLAGFLLWAGLAPLDEGVPARGTVMIDTKRKGVQHLTGGLIEQVLVREGQYVEAHDLLIRLDDGPVRAEYESWRQRYLGLRANEDRLVAEQASEVKIRFHPDVMAAQDDPVIHQHMQTQQQLLASRRLALNSEIAALEEAVQSQKEAASGFAAQLAARRQQAALLGEERGGLRELVAEGYAPRNRLLEVERLTAEIGATMSDVQANLARAKRSAGELTLKKIQREQEFRREIDNELAAIRREVTADQERFKAAREALERTEIRAPASGYVIGLLTQTVGGVITAGTRVMDIVPKNEKLTLEAQIPPHLIDRVRAGQHADIRFSNFALSPMLVVEGELVSVSADLLTDPATNAGYYLARVVVTDKGVESLGQHSLQPGMPAEIVVKTGERSLLAYLMHPLVRRIAQSMKEE